VCWADAFDFWLSLEAALLQSVLWSFCNAPVRGGVSMYQVSRGTASRWRRVTDNLRRFMPLDMSYILPSSVMGSFQVSQMQTHYARAISINGTVQLAFCRWFVVIVVKGLSWFISAIIVIIIIIIEFIMRLLQCGHGHRCIILSVKLKLVNSKNNQSAEL